MLLDAASLYFRAYYGVPRVDHRARTAHPSTRSAVSPTWSARLVGERRPTRLVACLDLDWRPAFRVEALPSYKAHRVPGEPEAAPAGLPG